MRGGRRCHPSSCLLSHSLVGMLLTRRQGGSTPLAVNHWGPLTLRVLAEKPVFGKEVGGTFWGRFLGRGGCVCVCVCLFLGAL